MTITLEALFQQLSVAELSNVAAGNKGDGTVREKDQPAVVVQINDCLDELYRKFSIREKSFILEPIEGHDRYKISLDHGVSQDGITVGPHYIQDTVLDPFDDDVLQFIDAVDSEGNDYAFNDSLKPRSIHTPEFDVLQIPYAKEGISIAIEYRAKPDKLDSCDLTQVLDVPTVLVPAMRAYIAGNFLQNIGTAKSIQSGAQFMMQYEEICQSVVNSNILMQDRNTIGDRFIRNGWT